MAAPHDTNMEFVSVEIPFVWQIVLHMNNLKAIRSKFDVSIIVLNSKVVATILKSICIELIASTSWLLGILV